MRALASALFLILLACGEPPPRPPIILTPDGGPQSGDAQTEDAESGGPVTCQSSATSGAESFQVTCSGRECDCTRNGALVAVCMMDSPSCSALTSATLISLGCCRFELGM